MTENQWNGEPNQPMINARERCSRELRRLGSCYEAEHETDEDLPPSERFAAVYHFDRTDIPVIAMEVLASHGARLDDVSTNGEKTEVRALF